MASLESESNVVGLGGPVSLDLGNGVSVLLSPVVVDEADLQEVSWADSLDPETFFESVRSFTSQLTDALRAAAPTKITAEFGVKAAVKAGKLTALLVDGKGEATISVTLEWDRTKVD